jgi:hypothetical protein
MIEMAVGQENLLETYPALGDFLAEAPDFAAWVDDGTAPGLRAPNERAILLIGRDRQDTGFKGTVGHGFEVKR